MGAAIMSLLSGALKGNLDETERARERKRQDAEDNLRTLSVLHSLSQDPAFQIGDNTTAPGAPAGGPAGAPAGPASPLAAVSKALGIDALPKARGVGERPWAADAASPIKPETMEGDWTSQVEGLQPKNVAPVPPAQGPAESASSRATPPGGLLDAIRQRVAPDTAAPVAGGQGGSSVLRNVARVTLGGRDLGVSWDAGRAGRERDQKESDNRTAFEQLHTQNPDAYPAFVKSADYLKELRDNTPARREARQQATTDREEATFFRSKYPEFATMGDDQAVIRLARQKFASDLTAGRQPGGAGGPERRQDLATVEHQVDDTRADLGRAEGDVNAATRAMPKRPVLPGPALDAFPADSTRGARRLKTAQSAVDQLRTRADSLNHVRDSIAGVVQGRAPATTAQKAKSRALELHGQGKSRADILRILRSEGYNVQ